MGRKEDIERSEAAKNLVAAKGQLDPRKIKVATNRYDAATKEANRK
jgi:hypothetical protein